MAKVNLSWIQLQIECDCGKEFIAGELQTGCPYCDREYAIQLEASPAKLELRIEPKPAAA